MTENALDQEFIEFLKKKKIDTTSLSQKDKDVLFEPKKQRMLAILKARFEAYPHDSYENYRD